MFCRIIVACLFFFCWSSGFSQVTEQSRKRDLKLQNNTGKPANDFSYVSATGKKMRMYGVRASHVLLFFYNPECEACKQYKKALANSIVINSAIKSGKLKILAMYIDKDIALWKRHLPEMPSNWLHGRDTNEYLFKNNIYDLHAIPTIYLLDKNKKVILKDVLSVAVIEREVMR